MEKEHHSEVFISGQPERKRLSLLLSLSDFTVGAEKCWRVRTQTESWHMKGYSRKSGSVFLE